MSLARPLELQSRLRAPELGPDVAALFDIALIVLMLGLLGSRFVYAPGTTVGLEELRLPRASQARVPGAPTVDVLTLLPNQRLIYRGRFLSLEAWAAEMAVAPPLAARGLGATLLLKADERVTLQSFLRVSDVARAAGYERVQIAERPAGEPDSLRQSGPAGF